MKIVCPKCNSAYIEIVQKNGEIIYKCKNNKTDGQKLCNWIESYDNRFLSLFLDEKTPILEIKNTYSALHLIAERLNINSIPKLFKNNKLISKIERTTNFESIFKDLCNKFLSLTLPNKPDLKLEAFKKDNKNFFDLIIFHSNFFENTNSNENNYYSKMKEVLEILMTYLKDSGNIVITCEDKFEDNEYISIPDKILNNYYMIKNELKLRMVFKRLIVIPNLLETIQSDLGVGFGNFYCLYFIKDKKKNYFHKISIVEKHFWKDYEFGKRKTPYNIYGKDPGSFWIKSELDKEKTKDMSQNEIKKYVYETGQEKYKYIFLSKFEIYGRILLSLSPVNGNILEIFPVDDIVQKTTHNLYRNYYYLKQ